MWVNFVLWSLTYYAVYIHVIVWMHVKNKTKKIDNDNVNYTDKIISTLCCHYNNNKLWAGSRHDVYNYGPAQVCKWWHDIRHVRIWIGHHYCMSMLACQYNQPKWPGDLDLESQGGIWVTCDMGYLCANFSLAGPLCSRVAVAPDVHDR